MSFILYEKYETILIEIVLILNILMYFRVEIILHMGISLLGEISQRIGSKSYVLAGSKKQMKNISRINLAMRKQGNRDWKSTGTSQTCLAPEFFKIKKYQKKNGNQNNNNQIVGKLIGQINQF